ncbi:MAG: sulfite exporter TauE/SafE family protein [Leptolyngbyaceae cyanobacterium RU_5_1]|nr:sulfite exporter TauE/SafE family protein [Leptolyngbyaceae cyanobacterium RU_5_1]
MIDQPMTWGWLFLLGIFTGAVAGVLGIGGGLLIVPALTFFLRVNLVQATATSLVGVLLSAISGSGQNWRKGKLDWRASLGLALFGMPTAQLGAWLGDRLPEAWLAFSFATLMLIIIYLMDLKQKLKQRNKHVGLSEDAVGSRDLAPVAKIGLLTGVLSGLFGVGGGAVMVPLQMLMLGEAIKAAVRTSLGAIVLIAASGLIQHAWNGNVLYIPGLALGFGGMVGAQFGTRLLPHLPDRLVNLLFRLLLIVLSIYMTWRGVQAWNR